LWLYLVYGQILWRFPEQKLIVGFEILTAVLAACFMLVSFLANSSTLKIEEDVTLKN
jgi:hypothetical protein